MLVTKWLLQQSLLYPYSPIVYVAIKQWTCGKCKQGTNIFILFYVITSKQVNGHFVVLLYIAQL